ncbi:MAG TPA: ATP-binding protein, partial [Dongiaceae bacterium]|nr:ATP-binding protein [Dongiaceae bacterium]
MGPRRRNRSNVALAVLSALALLVTAAPAIAHDRLVRQWDERSGLVVSEIVELAQDSTGFLWIGTSGGLVRFDGREMRPWAADQVHHVVRSVSCGPGATVVVAAANEPIWEATANGVRTATGPGGGPIVDWVHASLDHAGDLWVLASGRLSVRDRQGAWRTLDSTAFDSGAFYRVRPWGSDTVFIATDRGLWRMTPRGRPEWLAAIPRVQDVARLPDGRVAVLTRLSAVLILESGGPREIYRGGGRATALVARDDVLWATAESHLLRLAPGASPDTVAPTVTIPTGRPLLVDREGSLWLGGYHGLLQFPEPETVVWDERDGLPSPNHAFMIHHADDAVWVTTWFGAVMIPDRGAPRRAQRLGERPVSYFSDTAGDLWSTRPEQGFVRRHRSAERFFPRPGVHRILAASRRSDGTLWLATDVGLFRTPAAPGGPVPVATPPPSEFGTTWADCPIGAVATDRDGMLWITKDEWVAHAPADSVAAGRPVSWRIDRLKGTDYALALATMPSGALWAATSDGGVWRHPPGGGWEPVPGSRALASARVYDLAPSPAGGLWVLADGSIWRVRERTDLPAGWEVLESLTAWQGAPSRQTGGLIELADGRIWLASLAGVVEMPATARHAVRRPPPVALVDQRVDGRPLPMDGALRLPWKRNRLELRFAALSFREPSLIRYQFRLREGATWTNSMEPDLHLVDLAPGAYRVAMRASLDGAHWTAAPATVPFTVLAPWWREPWALALFALVLAALLFTAHRVRVGMLLRLERQRTRIAMDLHDEMGSGLGSIGILAGLASEPRLDDHTRRQLAGQIAEAAGELGGALSDIVWSLRADADTLEAFAFRLAERGGRLFPEPPPAFTSAFPDRWPAIRVAAGLRRQLQFIALEALHNAARHARAAHVTLGLAAEGAEWRLWVSDDGTGFAPSATGGRGHGLGNLERRAAAIGARLRVISASGAGTTVELRFHPGTEPDRTHGADIA